MEIEIQKDNAKLINSDEAPVDGAGKVGGQKAVKKNALLDKGKDLIEWILARKFSLSHRNFFLILCVVVGLIAGIAAVLLKVTTHYLIHILQVFQHSQNIELLFYPVIGILLATAYTQMFRKGNLGRGIGNVVKNIYSKSSYMEKDKLYSHMITSSLTVGLGGSMGLEAPIVVTGAAVGSNIASLFKLEYKERTLLLACGAAAGISGIFGAPIAGVLFSIEVLLGEFSAVNLVPLLIASAIASVVSQLVYKEQIFTLLTTGWDMKALPFYVVLGLLTGLYGIYITKGIAFSEKLLKPFSNPYVKALVGGLLLGGIVFLFPPIYGEGYHTVQMLLNGNYTDIFDSSVFYNHHTSIMALFFYTLAILLIKIVASQLTFSAGGNGGFFAPSLFMGANIGFFYSFFINETGLFLLNVPNFIAVAMAGVMSGVMHTPLTAIFLIAEATGGYSLLVPLMIVSSFSFLMSKKFLPDSIYTMH